MHDGRARDSAGCSGNGTAAPGWKRPLHASGHIAARRDGNHSRRAVRQSAPAGRCARVRLGERGPAAAWDVGFPVRGVRAADVRGARGGHGEREPGVLRSGDAERSNRRRRTAALPATARRRLARLRRGSPPPRGDRLERQHQLGRRLDEAGARDAARERHELLLHQGLRQRFLVERR